MRSLPRTPLASRTATSSPTTSVVTREGESKFDSESRKRRIARAERNDRRANGDWLRRGTVGQAWRPKVRGGAVDPRADIFAVGAVLYELPAGAPASGGNRRGIATAILSRSAGAPCRRAERDSPDCR